MFTAWRLAKFIITVHVRAYLHDELIEGFPLVGESFSIISAEEAMKFAPALSLIQFGTQAPVAIFKYGDKIYYHPTQDPAQVQAVES
jgi:hypothetical protein